MSEQGQTTQTTETLITEQKPALDFSLGKPEGFPDEFWDEEKKAPVVDKLYEAYTNNTKRMEGLRQKLSKGEFEGKAPEDYKEYTLELTDELKEIVKDDDPIYDAARQAAKEAGIPKEMFSKFMLPVVTKLAEMNKELTAEPSEEDIAAAREAEIAKLGPAGTKVVQAVGAYIEQLRAGGTFSEAEAQAAKDMVRTADQARVFNKLRMMTGGKDQIPVEVPIDVRASRLDIETKMASAMAMGNEAEYLKYSAMLSKLAS